MEKRKADRSGGPLRCSGCTREERPEAEMGILHELLRIKSIKHVSLEGYSASRIPYPSAEYRVVPIAVLASTWYIMYFL